MVFVNPPECKHGEKQAGGSERPGVDLSRGRRRHGLFSSSSSSEQLSLLQSVSQPFSQSEGVRE
eukprot:240656-Hanusia_phi.AAC.1